MAATSKAIIALEQKFWQSMIDEDTDTALSLLSEPSMMVSAHGAMKFDHAAYKKMAEQGSQVVMAYEMNDVEVVFPNDDTAILTYKVRQTIARRGEKTGHDEEMADSSTWIRSGDAWKCVMHTETPLSH